MDHENQIANNIHVICRAEEGNKGKGDETRK